MNYRMIRYLLGVILLIEAVFLMIPTLVSLLYNEDVWPFVITIAITLAISLPFAISKPKNTQIFAKEGFVTVAAGWILLSLFGSLPFILSGAISNPIDAFFETVSGFTTTGSTIIPNIEILPRGILFWRSLTHWIGGMGVLVFMLAILPSANGETMHLMRAEVPGPTKGKLVPKMRQSSLILYGIYVALTIIQIICLVLVDMPFYDSVVTTFGTAGTGGFSVLNTSIAGYNNPAAEWIIAIFMILFGVNFNIYFLILMGKARDALKSEELKVYLLICALATIAIAIDTASTFNSASDTIRTAFFQVASIISTSGFSTVDFNLWTGFSKAVMLTLMITGACAGSTAGGLKISRVIILCKSALKEIRFMRRPKSINVVKLDNEVVPSGVVRSASGYIVVYLGILLLTTLIISLDGFSLETNVSATFATLNNVGPGFDKVGPLENFSIYSNLSTIVLSFTMLIGRLEIMPMMILFSTVFGRRK